MTRSLTACSSLSLSLSLQEVPQRELELEEMPMEVGGEQGRWEEERLKTACLSFGAKQERERGMKEERDRYQLILEEDEMINFVSSAVTMKGTMTEKVPARHRLTPALDGPCWSSSWLQLTPVIDPKYRLPGGRGGGPVAGGDKEGVHPGGAAVAADIPLPGGPAGSHRPAPDPGHRGGDGLREDHTDPPVSHGGGESWIF